MKTKLRPIFILAAIAPVFLMSGCQDRYMQTYEVSNPVYMSYDELRIAVSDTTPQEINHPGKIYLLGDFIFVNEVRKGIRGTKIRLCYYSL